MSELLPFLKIIVYFIYFLPCGLRIKEILACSKMQKISQTKTDFHATTRFKL